MKFGIRTPSLKRRIAARTSVKRMVRAKVRAPRGYGILTNPKKAMYNKVYNKTSISVDRLVKMPKAKPAPHNKPMNAQPATPSKPATITGVNQTGKIIRSSQKALTVGSQNFNELKQEITDIYNQRVKKREAVNRAKVEYTATVIIHIASYFWIIGFFYKGFKRWKDSKKQALETLKQELAETYVKLQFSDKSQLEKSWLNCIDGFDELATTEKAWDVTYSEQNDRIAARTIAENSIKRDTVVIDKQKLEFINCDLENIRFANTNGPDLYLYPTFLILFKNYTTFSIYDIRDLDLKLILTGYLEEEQVPGDTEIINHTWKKANKDGSMDRRYNGNYQIPIVKYGQFSISSQTGIDEVYMFSNFGGFMKFAEYFVAHVKKLGGSA